MSDIMSTIKDLLADVYRLTKERDEARKAIGDLLAEVVRITKERDVERDFHKEWCAGKEHEHEVKLAASDARVKRLEAVLYPLVVGALEAEAREDAPEYVNNEPYNGMCALPQCVPCGGTGATDLKHYEDVPIPDAVRCGACRGWGFLKHDPTRPALAETDD